MKRFKNTPSVKPSTHFRQLFVACLLTTIALAGCGGSFPTTDTGGRVYTVATTGDDDHRGTEKRPWRTIQHAADTVAPGDTVLVLAGTYDERVMIKISGEASRPVTFQAQGTVTMKGFTVHADHVTIRGFDITGTDNQWGHGWGIFVQGSNCVIEDNYVFNATRGGITLFADPPTPDETRECTVRNNRLYHNAMAGLEVHGRDHLVEGNEIWGTIQYHPNWNDPPDWVDADGIRFFGSGHTFRGNYVHDISIGDPENIDPHIDCFQTWDDEVSEGARDVVLEGNVCDLLTDDKMQTARGFMLAQADNLLIRNNIVKAYGGVNTGGGDTRHLKIVNNVFVNSLIIPTDRHPAGVGLENSPNATVKNNIFYDQPAQVIHITGSTAGHDIGYNCVYRSDGRALWGSPRPGDAWDVDPQFISAASADYRLAPDSPCIDAGAALPDVTTDFDGTSRPQGAGYDMGAYEASSQ
jgi:hypothetical protein